MLVVLTTPLNRLGVCWSSRPNQHYLMKGVGRKCRPTIKRAKQSEMSSAPTIQSFEVCSKGTQILIVYDCSKCDFDRSS